MSIEGFLKAAVSHCEAHTYLTAVRTLSKNNVEALPAGVQRSQPLKAKEKRSNQYLESDVWLITALSIYTLYSYV